MPRIDKPTGRVVALIVLMIFVAAALRGYLPAQDHAAHNEPGSGRAAAAFVIAALVATVTLLAIAVIARLRDPRAGAPSAGELSELVDRDRGRPNWRVLLIAFVVLVAWLVIMVLLVQLFMPHTVTPSAPARLRPPQRRACERPAATATPARQQPGHGRNTARRHDPDASGDRRRIGDHGAATVARNHTGHHRRRSLRIPDTDAPFGIAGPRGRSWTGGDRRSQPGTA